MPPIPMPHRLLIACALGFLSWRAGEWLEHEETLVLTCTHLVEGQRLRSQELLSTPARHDDFILDSEANRAALEGKVYAATGCVDGQLTLEGVIDPAQFGEPADGMTRYVLVGLDNVSPQQAITLYLGEWRVADLRVLQVGHHTLPRDELDQPVISNVGSEITVEIPNPPGEGLMSCLSRTGELRASPTNPDDATPWMKDCRFLDKPRPGHGEFSIAARDVRVGERVDIVLKEKTLVFNARIIAGPSSTHTGNLIGFAVLEVPNAARKELDNCKQRGLALVPSQRESELPLVGEACPPIQKARRLDDDVIPL